MLCEAAHSFQEIEFACFPRTDFAREWQRGVTLATKNAVSEPANLFVEDEGSARLIVKRVRFDLSLEGTDEEASEGDSVSSPSSGGRQGDQNGSTNSSTSGMKEGLEFFTTSTATQKDPSEVGNSRRDDSSDPRQSGNSEDIFNYQPQPTTTHGEIKGIQEPSEGPIGSVDTPTYEFSKECGQVEDRPISALTTHMYNLKKASDEVERQVMPVPLHGYHLQAVHKELDDGPAISVDSAQYNFLDVPEQDTDKRVSPQVPGSYGSFTGDIDLHGNIQQQNEILGLIPQILSQEFEFREFQSEPDRYDKEFKGVSERYSQDFKGKPERREFKVLTERKNEAENKVQPTHVTQDSNFYKEKAHNQRRSRPANLQVPPKKTSPEKSSPGKTSPETTSPTNRATPSSQDWYFRRHRSRKARRKVKHTDLLTESEQFISRNWLTLGRPFIWSSRNTEIAEILTESADLQTPKLQVLKSGKTVEESRRCSSLCGRG
ncbi:hypothetical protein R1flu_006070 [Riccia fluitans]|uniref:Uncharacterized protein n=1 Tax=Riccia fluitans TaxID=41844 RepID=A0ABD1YV00_9MARC